MVLLKNITKMKQEIISCKAINSKSLKTITFMCKFDPPELPNREEQCEGHFSKILTPNPKLRD